MVVDGEVPWQLAQSAMVPLLPWISTACTLSFTWEVGRMAWVEPWQASHCRPPWPVEKRNREIPAAGVLGLVAKMVFAGWRTLPLASNTDVNRIWPLLLVAVPVWHSWQAGSSSQPWRCAEPTASMAP